MQNQEEPIFSEYKPRRASDDIADEIKKAILEKIERHLSEFKETIKSVSDEARGGTLSQILEFHELLSEATHIPPLIIFHRTIKTWAERKLVHWLPTMKEKKDQYTSHKKIFEAIKARDGNGAQDLMETHIRKTMANWD